MSEELKNIDEAPETEDIESVDETETLAPASNSASLPCPKGYPEDEWDRKSDRAKARYVEAICRNKKNPYIEGANKS